MSVERQLAAESSGSQVRPGLRWLMPGTFLFPLGAGLPGAGLKEDQMQLLSQHCQLTTEPCPAAPYLWGFPVPQGWGLQHCPGQLKVRLAQQDPCWPHAAWA